MSRALVLENIASGNHGEQFIVGRVGQAFEGKWQRKVVFIEGWAATEDEARAIAHRLDHP